MFALENKTFFIAEAGINHNGDTTLAKRLIDAAKDSGADCVKFQKRTISKVFTKEQLSKEYTNSNSYGKTYGEHKQFLEFDKDQFKELADYAKQKEILFTASGWDTESIDLLDSLDVPFFKIASADLTNLPLLRYTAKKGKPMIISTGMADLEQVKIAYQTIVKTNGVSVVICQCTSSYPCPFDEINLNVIKTYTELFPDAVIGYSGHEKGIAISLAAVVMGAKVIERHLTLDRTMKGNDHSASLEPQGLAKLIRDVRTYEKALGSEIKVIQKSEELCIKKLRKSIVSAKLIPKGKVISVEDLDYKSPGTGLSPIEVDKILGKVALEDILEDTILTEKLIN